MDPLLSDFVGCVFWKSCHSSNSSLDKALQHKMLWTDYHFLCFPCDAHVKCFNIHIGFLCSCVKLTHIRLVNEITAYTSVLFVVVHMQNTRKPAFSITFSLILLLVILCLIFLFKNLTQVAFCDGEYLNAAHQCGRVAGRWTVPCAVVLNFWISNVSEDSLLISKNR